MINWQQVETVLLDMDGTLLDLHFDNHFWLTVIPHHISKLQQRPVEEVTKQLYQQYNAIQGSLNWYCIHHWQQQLQVDIMQLKRQYTDKIRWLKDVRPFLNALASKNKQRILITNAHPLSLELKRLHTGLDNYLDQLYSTHQFGAPKESLNLWAQLQKTCRYDPAKTLFIDDNESLLEVSKQAGIGFQLGIAKPDSQQPPKRFTQFQSITQYSALTQQLLQS